jgi:soluble lytic murein transglycosylase-like protein
MGMRVLAAAVVLLVPGGAFAGDIGDALLFAEEVMVEEDISAGLERFIDEHPDEALSLLLYDRNAGGEGGIADLGDTRLSYAAIARHIAEASEETGLPIALIDAVIRTESGYRPQAVSRVGAQGLMQLMPATAREVGVRNPFDPRQNILGGARYLRRMFDRFGTLKLAIAAYNAGPNAVAKHNGVPPFRETKAYVRTVMTRYHQSRLSGVEG